MGLGLKKLENNKAELLWQVAVDPAAYYYEIELSTDGSNFTRADIVEKQLSGSASISYNYAFTINHFNETYFFGIKRKFLNGKTLLNDTKSISFDESKLSEFSLFPNPSNGIIGIKFDKNTTGNLLVVITNAQGQTVFNKQIEISDNNDRQITTLQRGMYLVNVEDVTGQKSFVSQLFIK